MLILTDWKTIKETNEDIGFKERPIDKFINKLEKNLGKEGYKLYFDEQNNSFKVLFDGVEHRLRVYDDLDEDNSKNNISNSVSSKFKILADKLKQLEIKESKQRENERDRKRIIEDAKNGTIVDADAQRIYLEYLTKQNKNKTEKSEYFKNFVEDWSSNFKKTHEILNRKSSFFNVSVGEYYGATAAILVIGTVCVGLISLFTQNPLPLKITAGVLSLPIFIPFSHTAYHQIKTRTERVKNYIEEKTFEKDKIKLIKSLKFEKKSEQPLQIQETMKASDRTLEKDKSKETFIKSIPCSSELTGIENTQSTQQSCNGQAFAQMNDGPKTKKLGL